MAKPELGAKRQCQNCGTKFFDFARSPIVCPKCGTTFVVAAAARAPARAAKVVDDEEPVADPAAAELVSLEDAEPGAEKPVEGAEDDLEIEDAPADDAFLEEEEEDSDDVSGLIDGDLENDEEP